MLRNARWERYWAVLIMINSTRVALVAALLLASASASPKLESSLKPGATVTAFQVQDVSGPARGKQLCYVCRSGGRPLIIAFIHDDPARGAAVAAHLQTLTQKYRSKDLQAFVVFLGGPELKEGIDRLARDKNLVIPLTFPPQGVRQPDLAPYALNTLARNTVLVCREHKVRANFVNVDEKSFPAVAKAAAKMLSK